MKLCSTIMQNTVILRCSHPSHTGVNVPHVYTLWCSSCLASSIIWYTEQSGSTIGCLPLSLSLSLSLSFSLSLSLVLLHTHTYAHTHKHRYGYPSTAVWDYYIHIKETEENVKWWEGKREGEKECVCVCVCVCVWWGVWWGEEEKLEQPAALSRTHQGEIEREKKRGDTARRKGRMEGWMRVG